MNIFNFFHLKMRLPNCVLVSVLLMIADGFTVRGPSAPLVAPLGSSVVLSCYVDKPLPMEGLEVKWRRTDSDADSETVVHLFLDGDSRPETQHQDYHNRAHFFTDQIQHGNFSLRLDNLRAEDEGNYTCKVYSQQDSGETEVQIKAIVRGDERNMVEDASLSWFLWSTHNGVDSLHFCIWISTSVLLSDLLHITI
ncbi:myelin-oligodendrocyte glycoprotein-like [Pseudorasbora parva]|uniref:myelin-oligodendrocyte glycoprotein-like n=1 Tax=Pseudorasbora parva TaxID=51549 RepID=UPI00351E1589